MKSPTHRLAIALSIALLVACQPQANGVSTAAKSNEASPAAPTTAAQTLASEQGPIRVTEVVRGLDHPWALAFLPDGNMLVTERSGQLRRISRDGKVSAPLAGVPKVFAEGQGGLLDVALSPDFASSQRIYLSYSEPGDNGTAGTAVALATLGEAGLTDVKVIYRQEPKLEGPNHFGSRLAFDGQGHIFISQGERNKRPTAQELDKLQGKLVRLNLDGSVPRDNPFVGQADVRPEIWSYGHRNMQGMAIDPRTGKLWENEHGPRGGDEINLPQPGKNYGWPIVTHGINYSGLAIPEAEGREKPGMESPYHVWEKSPGLSGMAFYTGRPGAPWNDSLFLGALAERNLIRLTLQGDKIVGEERLLNEIGERVRDVRVGPDDSVYVLTDEKDGKLFRIEPPKTP
ncbi:PQQ-dependent sugar dehydrogenase [Pseudoxanthomonas sp. UTMC 1351]|uniref:PQQ-dependent sugar dehydrogenase n=1 Tax=Pseudoxanthomonas sp. UTMC 1351 TaxID=2695853 RepID=UPI0034CE95CE